MIINFRIFWHKYILGDWFTVVDSSDAQLDMIVYGIYHPTRNHQWDFPYFREVDAQRKCDELNSNILNEKPYRLWF